jgi:hypothetical protein
MRLTRKLVLHLNIEGTLEPLFFTHLQKALNKLGKRVVSGARKVLASQNKVVSGNLSRSLYYTIEGTKDTIEVTFAGGVPYWDFVEQGVKGKISDKKAPHSPFQFGSGKPQASSGTLRGGIDRWVIQKPVGQIRDKAGRFVTRKSMVSAISWSVYNYGIAPSNYYSIALDRGFKKAKKMIAQAVGEDVFVFLREKSQAIYSITIII